jgi:endonuclease G, mitochondrial
MTKKTELITSLKKNSMHCHNDNTHEANWTAWHLCTADLGKAGRGNKFCTDITLPDGWYRVAQSDYQFVLYGFDRGHLCPSADRTASAEDNNETFLMTNMVPQAPDNNRIVWKALEEYERVLVTQGNELYIIAGPYGKGGISEKGIFELIKIPKRQKDGNPVIADNGMFLYSNMSITVPACTWKIIIVLPEGKDDIDRVTEDTRLLAVCIPNRQGCGKTGSWEQYRTSVDIIEKMTGYDFFARLPDNIENCLEAEK